MLCLALVLSLSSSVHATVYYVDSASGHDGNSGTSSGDAWASLTPVNALTLGPGDMVLFKADTSYTGQLKPMGSGADGNPVIIDMYGTGAKPRIDGEGDVNQTLLLENVEYYEVSNLEITNTGSTAGISGRMGVRVWANSPSLPIAHHIHLKNLYVHDVNGSLIKDGRGVGINIWCSGSTSRFDDLLIEDCHLVRTDRDGIGFWSNYYDPTSNWNPSTNVVVRGNRLEDIGGDGIVVVGCEGALVEYNTLNGGRMRTDEPAAGMWPWGSTHTLFQYNEVSGMVGTLDGQAFDCDYHCDGTIFQYNYSHDNDGGFMLFASPGNSSLGVSNSIVRYNISENDGSNSRVFNLVGKVTNSKIYNNVVYLGPGRNNLLVRTGAWGVGTPDGNQFYNNIFYADGNGRWRYDISTGSGMVFENNVFYGDHFKPPSDAFALYSDPMLVGPGTGGSGLDSVGGYMLQEDSPAIDSGQEIAGSGGWDYWGNPVTDGMTDRGAHEFYSHSGDIDSDGDVDLGDFALFGLWWLDTGCGSCGGADFTGEGDVTIDDLNIMVSNWLVGL